MDHTAFWDWPFTGPGKGYGAGTANIIDYIGSLTPSQYTGPYNHMVRVDV